MFHDTAADNRTNRTSVKILYEIRQTDSPKVVLPGDFIGLGYISGHGTRVDIKTQKIFATLSGVVQFIDRVISVQPLSQGYWPDVGDLVVGRVVQVD